jgi:nicotinamidase-related amidase
MVLQVALLDCHADGEYILLVIDLLNDYFRRQPPVAAQRDQLVASVNRLPTAFRQARQPIVWVRQEFAPDLSEAFLRARREHHRVKIAGTDGCELLPELQPHASDTVTCLGRDLLGLRDLLENFVTSNGYQPMPPGNKPSR